MSIPEYIYIYIYIIIMCMFVCYYTFLIAIHMWFYHCYMCMYNFYLHWFLNDVYWNETIFDMILRECLFFVLWFYTLSEMTK